MEGKNLAKKIAMALLCTAALPAASQASQDAEYQTFLAKGGCGGEEDSSATGKGSCAATSNQKKSHSCAAAGSHSCAAATSNKHSCGASTSHSCGANTSNKHACGAQNGDYSNQSGSTVNNNSNQHVKTTYTGTSTPAGPNDGYPSTPREMKYSEYPKNENSNSKNYNMNQR